MWFRLNFVQFSQLVVWCNSRKIYYDYVLISQKNMIRYSIQDFFKHRCCINFRLSNTVLSLFQILSTQVSVQESRKIRNVANSTKFYCFNYYEMYFGAFLSLWHKIFETIVTYNFTKRFLSFLNKLNFKGVPMWYYNATF